MADETTVKGVAGQEHFTKDKSTSLESDRSKAKDEEKLLKEKFLDEKMKLIRQKNKERLRRQKEIEEDIKNASLHSLHSNQVAEEKPAITEHKMAGVQKANSSTTRMRGRARGRILAKMAKEELQAHRFQNKRKQNYEDVEDELQQERIRDSSPKGSSSFLSDDRRVDMSKLPSRSTHSWGGSQFEDVVEKVNKEKQARPRREDQNLEVSMTGKERKQYLEWKEERNRIDRERKLRQKSGESWKREWDQEKANREVHSTHDRHDQHHPRHSGQRFGARTRRKPDWDLHDNRVPDTEVHHKENNEDEKDNWEEKNDQKINIITSNDAAEDWEDSSPTNLERHRKSGLKGEASSSASMEDSTTTRINKNDDSNTNIHKQSAVHTAADSSEMSKCTIVKVDSKESVENVEPRKNHEEAGIDIDIKNLTVTIDSEGKRNISDEIESKVSDDKNEGNKEAVTVKQNHEIIEQPKPQRIHKTKRHKEEKDAQNSQDQKNEDLTKEMVENERRKGSETEIQASDKTTDQKDGSDSTTNSHLEKAKDSLPKLKIKKADENNEPVPDFLKTPQKKNWADCEFDEEELPPLEWGSLTK